MKNVIIGVIGQGYVGLPLSIAFGKKFTTVGFDINKHRIKTLKNRIDINNEISKLDFLKSKNLEFTYDIKDLKKCNFFIVTVPSPILKNKIPDLSYVKKASEIVAKVLTKNSTVVFESTVYPGVTENICLPIIEKKSLLKLNKDFYLGYSPERANPGDKKNTLENIKKITSGSNNRALSHIDKIYRSIIKVGTVKASSIKIAEAAKVIENVQRDLNISLMNELSVIFDKINLDTNEIIKCASSKWNFFKAYPGLVGGHCIGVDPYYLTYLSKKKGHYPKLILAGRYTNDNMYKFVGNKFLKILKAKYKNIKNKKVLLMGYSFKENVSDVRNTQVENIFNFLKKKIKKVHIFDPLVDKNNLPKLVKKHFIDKPSTNFYDAAIILVKHSYFLKLGVNKIKRFCKKDNPIIFDVKNSFEKNNMIFKL